MKKLILGAVLITGSLYARDVMPVNNKLYANECGSCHFAYQPGLMLENSWKKIMRNLSNHFKVDASLNKKDTMTLTSYLVKNSSDKSSAYLSRVITKYTNPNRAPLRITQGQVFRSYHEEVRSRFFKRKSVGSASNCATCHTTASRGIYNENYVRIPR